MYTIGIDIGGTFTDCVIIDDENNIYNGKSPSTPQDFSIGFMESINNTLENMGVTLEELLKQTRFLNHSTTVGTNAFITRRGARTGLITTKGFEDVILIMRAIGRVAGLPEERIQFMARTFKPDPIVPRPLIEGVTERIDYRGRIVVRLNEDEVREAVKRLVEEKGVESIAVSFLWSFANPVHEQRVRRIIKEMYPNIYVSLSSEVSPRLGEYERTATTVINAYLSPLMENYITSIENNLKKYGLKEGALSFMQCSGGVVSAEEAKSKAVGSINSGPVGGVIASKFIGEILGYKNIIGTDVGGTSFDISIVYQEIPEYSKESIIGQYHISLPMVDIKSIGAGGGSIAWIEEPNYLRVGPQSAGAFPGPACYDQGGEAPTATDASLILGYINPEYFFGGKKRLNKDKAIEAMKKIALPLKLDVIEAASGVYDIINANMGDLIRTETIGKGLDPAEFITLIYGGAGPGYGGVYTFEAGISKGIIPPISAGFSALGAAIADIKHIYEITDPMNEPIDIDKWNSIFDRMEKMAFEKLKKAGIEEENMIFIRTADFRYKAQFHHVRTPIHKERLLNEEDAREVYETFDRRYEELYGKGSGYKEAGRQVVTYRVEAIGVRKKYSIPEFSPGGSDPSRAFKGRREVFWRKYGGFRMTDIFEGSRLKPENMVYGPAIIEFPLTTVVIPPDIKATVGRYMEIILERC